MRSAEQESSISTALLFNLNVFFHDMQGPTGVPIQYSVLVPGLS